VIFFWSFIHTDRFTDSLSQQMAYISSVDLQHSSASLWQCAVSEYFRIERLRHSQVLQKFLMNNAEATSHADLPQPYAQEESQKRNGRFSCRARWLLKTSNMSVVESCESWRILGTINFRNLIHRNSSRNRIVYCRCPAHWLMKTSNFQSCAYSKCAFSNPLT
jgi:hypothetical protein